MRAKDIAEHFLSQADWVDRAETVDRVIIGDPETDVDRCLVTWMPSMAALRAMVDRGMSLLVCHEPTFWNHRDNRAEDEAIRLKEQFIKDHGLVIVRNHDCWDRWPGVGIPWAWARFLELGPVPAQVGGKGYQHRYDIGPVPLDAFAARVASRCALIGEPAVQVTGDPAAELSRIGIGTGCGCTIAEYMNMGCDCSIVCDDGSCYWSDIQRAEDLGHAVIRVNHGTSEEPGMVSLTDYINEHIDGVQAEHLPHGSTFRLIGGAPAGN